MLAHSHLCFRHHIVARIHWMMRGCKVYGKKLCRPIQNHLIHNKGLIKKAEKLKLDKKKNTLLKIYIYVPSNMRLSPAASLKAT